MAEKKIIYWLTGDFFIDVDNTLVPYLQDTAGYEIRWFVLQTWNNRSIPQSDRYTVVQLPYRMKDPRMALFLYRTFRRIGIAEADLIYSDFIGFLYYYPCLFAAKRRSTPVIHAAHNVVTYPAWTLSLKLAVKQAVGMNSHFQIFSRHTYDYFRNRYPGKSCFYSSMTVKDYGAPATDRYPMDPEKVNLLFFGNVVANKRLDLLIDAVKRLPEDAAKRVHLWICGNCRMDRKAFEEQIGDATNITACFRRIPDEEVAELFTKSDFLMLPYENVAQSGPHMIAYNYNLPVIAADIDGFTERVEDGRNGYLFRRNDVASLADTIVRAAATDRETRDRMRDEIARYVAGNCSLQVVADNYKRYFDRLLCQ